MRTTFDLQTIINKATTTNQMELLTLEEAKFLIGTEFIFYVQGHVGFHGHLYFGSSRFEFVKRK